MIAAAHPFDWHLRLFWLLALLGLVATSRWAARRRGGGAKTGPTTLQRAPAPWRCRLGTITVA